MKFEITASAQADFAKLNQRHKPLARAGLAAFAHACGDHADPRAITFPTSLRVKAVQGAPGIFEMTWSFSGPDGRATFEWASVTNDDGSTEPMVRWRRIGDHKIFKQP